MSWLCLQAIRARLESWRSGGCSWVRRSRLVKATIVFATRVLSTNASVGGVPESAATVAPPDSASDVVELSSSLTSTESATLLLPHPSTTSARIAQKMHAQPSTVGLSRSGQKRRVQQFIIVPWPIFFGRHTLRRQLARRPAATPTKRTPQVAKGEQAVPPCSREVRKEVLPHHFGRPSITRIQEVILTQIGFQAISLCAPKSADPLITPIAKDLKQDLGVSLLLVGDFTSTVDKGTRHGISLLQGGSVDGTATPDPPRVLQGLDGLCKGPHMLEIYLLQVCRRKYEFISVFLTQLMTS